MLNRKAYGFYKSYYELAEDMTDEQRGQYYHAILKMQFENIIEIPKDPLAKMAFKGQLFMLNQQLDGFMTKTKGSTPTEGGCAGGAEGPSEQVQVQVKEEVKEKVIEVLSTSITYANQKNDLLVKDKIDEVENSFNLWWDLYQKKIDHKKCKARWKKLTWDERREIWRHTQKYILAAPEKQYRKNPLTYLNGENWNDLELTEKKVAPKNNFAIGRSIDDVTNDILNGVGLEQNQKHLH